jgi:two-component system, cell cycle response regulator
MEHDTHDPTAIQYAAFLDRDLEHRYFSDYIRKSSAFLRWSLILASLIFGGMAAMDVLYLRNSLVLALVLRALISLMSLLAALYAHKWRNARAYSLMLIALGLGASNLTLWTGSRYLVAPEPQHLLMGLILMLFIQYFIHVSWMAANIAAGFVHRGLRGFLLRAIHQGCKSALSLFFSYFYLIFFMLAFSFLSYIILTYRHREFLDRHRLVQISVTDPLTGIYNRARFDELLEGLPELYAKHGRTCSLAFFDFDNFKQVNDLHGHIAGDQVIIKTVELVKRCIRSSDVFCRWGGEVFTILFPDTREQDAVAIVERIRFRISDMDFGFGKTVTASFGVTELKPNDRI